MDQCLNLNIFEESLITDYYRGQTVPVLNFKQWLMYESPGWYYNPSEWGEQYQKFLNEIYTLWIDKRCTRFWFTDGELRGDDSDVMKQLPNFHLVLNVSKLRDFKLDSIL